MIKAYDYLCTLNNNECKQYYDDYKKMLESTNKLIVERKENNAKVWAEALSGAQKVLVMDIHAKPELIVIVLAIP